MDFVGSSVTIPKIAQGGTVEQRRLRIGGSEIQESEVEIGRFSEGRIGVVRWKDGSCCVSQG